MSTNYHTAITNGADANAATFNSPLGQLDAQIAIATNSSTDANLKTTTHFVDSAFTTNVSLKRHATLSSALSNASAGDTIILGSGTWTGNITIPQHRIKIIGNGQAFFDGSSLSSDGTIIEGTIDCNGKLGVIVQNLTIDVSGSAADGFKTGSPSIASYGGRIIQNVNIIGSGAGNGYHGILIQRGDYNFIDNVYVYGFTHGIAIKSSYTTVSNIIAEDTSASSVIVKSDATAGDISHVNVTNVTLKGDGSNKVGGVLVESAHDSYKTRFVNICNVTGQYTDPATVHVVRNAAVGTIAHINILNAISFENADSGAVGSAAFWNDGASDVSFTNCRAINTDGYSFQNTGSGARISLNGCASDNPATNDTNGPFVNRELAGKPNNGVQVYLSGNLSIPNGTSTFTAIAWDTELFDEAEMHSTSTNTSRLVARGEGYYEITAVLKYDAHATGQRHVRINPSTGSPAQSFVQDSVGGSQHTTVMTTAVFYLDENDYVEIETAQTSGGALNLLGLATQSMAVMRKL